MALVMFGLRKIIKLYENHSVACTGMKGSGKDLLISNVVTRRKVPYICNIDYTHDTNFIPLDFNDFNIHNTRKELVSGNVNYYEWMHPLKTDVYISDAGVYFPSQYCNELNKEYPYYPLFLAIQRHLTLGGKTHYNCQNLNRVFDKIREMCDIYIYCHWSIYFKGLVIQKITIYDRASSCQDRVKTPRLPRSSLLFPNRDAEMQKQIYLDKFRNTYGRTDTRYLIYFNKANYDTHHFKKLLKEGKKNA